MKLSLTETERGEIRRNPDVVEKALRAAVKAAEAQHTRSPVIRRGRWHAIPAIDDLQGMTQAVYEHQMARLRLDILRILGE